MIPLAQTSIKNPFAVIAITKHGVTIARKLQEDFKKVDVYYASKLARGDEQQLGIQLFEGGVRETLSYCFKQYKGIILVFSLGAVLRILAPLLEDKKKDPCVVVIDNCAKFAISVLSGHLGGGNELTTQVANVLGAIPVITTASDVQETIAVDLLGKDFGWEWETAEHLTAVSAAVVNEEPVAIIQESGERNWWQKTEPLPPNLGIYPTVKAGILSQSPTAIIITHRILTHEEDRFFNQVVVFRPKVIVLGIGCNRGTSSQEIEQVIDETLQELSLAKKSVKAIVTIDIKKDEVGLLKVCEDHQWDFQTYPAEELNHVPISKRSDTVYRYTGAYGVSEPAAKLYSNNDQLLLIKKKSGNVTISVGLISSSSLKGA